MNRVLVVDDEAGMRAALEAHFLRRDWQVDTAANAGEALEKFLSRNSLRGDMVAISVPGQSGLARFVKLPPVEKPCVWLPPVTAIPTIAPPGVR